MSNQCNNTNSVKYIIEQEEYSLLETRTFSQQDIAEFLDYAPIELLESLPKETIKAILMYAQTHSYYIKKDMLEILFDHGLVLDYDSALTFAERDMDDRLEILLPKIEYTQEQYVQLWHFNKNCKNLIANYFNDEARKIMNDKYESLKKSYLRNSIPMIVICIMIFCVIVAGTIVAIVSVDPNSGSKSGYIASIIGILVISLFLVSLAIFMILHNVANIFDDMKMLRKYEEVLKYEHTIY